MFRGKTLIIAIFLAVVFVSAASLYAEASDAELFVKTIHISKIYPHQKGYKVVYVKSTAELGSFFVPIEWFQEAGGQAEIVMDHGPAFPYCSVFYNAEDGSFDHIRIYAMLDMSHYTWGAFDNNSAQDANFDVETFDIEY